LWPNSPLRNVISHPDATATSAIRVDYFLEKERDIRNMGWEEQGNKQTADYMTATALNTHQHPIYLLPH
jgi:hypothetical protein